MLMAACTTIIAVAPAARKAAKASGRRRAARRPRQATTAKHEHDRHGADEAELLADDREDEVGVGIRQEEELLPAPPEPVAEPSPGADGDQRLDRLEPRSQRIRLGPEEREQPRPAVVRREGDQDASSGHRRGAPKRKQRARAPASHRSTAQSIT